MTFNITFHFWKCYVEPGLHAGDANKKGDSKSVFILCLPGWSKDKQ